jgi:predicted permease
MIFVALVVACSSLLGAAYERRNGSARSVVRVMLRLMLYVLVPFVAFVNLAHLQVTVDAGAALICSYVAVLFAGTTAWLFGRELLRLERPALGALICTTIVANTGYLGFPTTIALLGARNLGAAVAYDAVVSGPMLYLLGFGVGAAFAAQNVIAARPGVRAFVIRNPPLLAAVAGLLVPASLVPSDLVPASEIVVAALLPLGFFAVGVSLSAAARERGTRILRWPDVTTVAAVGLRLALAPLLLLGFGATIVHVPSAYVLESAMPTGINTLIVGHAYGLDERQIATTVAWSTVAGLAVGLVFAAL